MATSWPVTAARSSSCCCPTPTRNSWSCCCERLRLAFQQAEPVGVTVDTLSLSVGMTLLYADDDLDEALQRADQALYRAKRGGRKPLRRHPGRSPVPDIRVGERRLAVAAGSNLLDALLAGGIAVPHSCRAGSCHACLVHCLQGEVDDTLPEALDPARREGLAAGLSVPGARRPRVAAFRS